jgi:hypothetical protein
MYDAGEGRFWLGSNNRSRAGNFVMGARHAGKWRTFGDWAIAVSGVGLGGMLVRESAGPGETGWDTALDVFSYLKDLLEKAGMGQTGSAAKKFDVSGLIARRGGELYDFDSALCVHPLPEGTFWARGSGMPVALGAAHALERAGRSPEEIVTGATEAAIAIDSTCPGDPVVDSF